MEETAKIVCALKKILAKEKRELADYTDLDQLLEQSTIKNFDFYTDPFGNNLAVQCAYANAPDVLEHLVNQAKKLDCDFNLDLPTPGEGRTALHIAALFGFAQFVDYLLTQNSQIINVNAQDCCKRTPFMLAKVAWRPDAVARQAIMTQLIQISDLTLQDKHGKKAEEYQGPYDYEQGRNCLDKNPATMALLSLKGREYWQHSLQKALSENPLSIFEVSDDGCHIVFHAILEGDLAVFTQLLELGFMTDKLRTEVWLNQREVRGLSVLQYCMFQAIFHKKEDFLRIFLETSKWHCIKLVDIPSFLGGTAQQMALAFERVDLAQLVEAIQETAVLDLPQRAPAIRIERDKALSDIAPDATQNPPDIVSSRCVV